MPALELSPWNAAISGNTTRAITGCPACTPSVATETWRKTIPVTSFEINVSDSLV